MLCMVSSDPPYLLPMICVSPADGVSCLQVGTYALFVGEVYAWYCVGEIVGRGFSVAGYNV